MSYLLTCMAGGHCPCLGQPTGGPEDHPLLDPEIRRLFGEIFSHVSIAPA